MGVTGEASNSVVLNVCSMDLSTTEVHDKISLAAMDETVYVSLFQLIIYIIPNIKHAALKKKIFSVNCIIIILKFFVTVAVNCLALSHCMNTSYVIGHERASSLLL